MPGPTSEWGREYTAKTEKLERNLLVLTAQLSTAAKILTGATALLVAVAGYFFISVSDLKSSVKGLEANVSDLKESAKIIHSAGATLSEDRDTLGQLRRSVDDLTATVKRLQNVPPPPPQS